MEVKLTVPFRPGPSNPLLWDIIVLGNVPAEVLTQVVKHTVHVKANVKHIACNVLWGSVYL
jgi:hypothetical protein